MFFFNQGMLLLGSNHFLKEKSIFLNNLLKYGKNLLTHDYALQNHVRQNRKIENGEFAKLLRGHYPDKRSSYRDLRLFLKSFVVILFYS